MAAYLKRKRTYSRYGRANKRRRVARRRVWRPRYRRMGLRRWKTPYNKPLVVNISIKEENKITNDSESWCMNFNMNFFNNSAARKQVRGFLYLYDQFKIINYSVVYAMKETDNLTNENTACPMMYNAYDIDVQGRSSGIDDLLMLGNTHRRYLRPWGTRCLSVRPVFDMVPQKYGDVTTYVRRVDNPWFDTALLVNNATQAPSLRTQNGHQVVLQHALNRTLIEHHTCRIAFKGMRKGQTYT